MYEPNLEDIRYRFKMADFDELTFYPTNQETAWLIKQAEKVERYETALKEISAIHNYDGFKAKDIVKIVLNG